MKKSTIQDQGALEKLQVFLKSNRLPYQDVTLEGSLYLTYQDEDNNICGSGGLELYGKYALLRSLAIDVNHRHQKVGIRLVHELLATARELNLETLFLLTETAQNFFEKIGFQTITRTGVPEEVRNSSEFASVCSSSAHCMMYTLS